MRGGRITSNQTIMEYIFARTIFNDRGCWEYIGECNQYGYGRVPYQDKDQLVTHVTWRLMKGKKVPEGKCLLHRCDNPPCWNPDHLFIGTRADNVVDMIAKGRASWQPSEKERRPISILKVIYGQTPRPTPKVIGKLIRRV
jgi:hypothetical protein